MTVLYTKINTYTHKRHKTNNQMKVDQNKSEETKKLDNVFFSQNNSKQIANKQQMGKKNNSNNKQTSKNMNE